MPRLAPIAGLATILCAPFAAASVYTGPGGPIPDAPDLEGPPGEITSDVLVEESIALDSISVTVTGLAHTWCGDVVIRLTHLPSGVSQSLVVRIGVPSNPPPNSFGDSSNFGGDYTFVDGGADIWAQAVLGGTGFVIPTGSYRPSGVGSGLPVPLLGAFAGIDAAGTWRLTVQDAAAGDTGSFVSWSLSVTGGEFPDCPAPGSCFAPHPNGGCDDVDCCTAVCDLLPDCCDVAWDAGCVTAAYSTCGGCGDPLAGDCCTAHAGTGCADQPCCEAICAVDVACCAVAWDAGCAAAAKDLPLCACPVCPAEGDCFQVHATPGCDQARCCDTVCTADPACCDVGWDADCVQLALVLCAGCGAPGVGECCTAHAGTGCADETCCLAICAIDISCCTSGWDESCAEAARDSTICGCPLPCPAQGSCFEAHGTPGCDSESCCLTVCNLDPFCCDDAWDSSCAAQALDQCTTCGDPDAGDCCQPHVGAGCSGDACCEAICAIDIACCTVNWDEACAEAARDSAICGCPLPCPGEGSCFEVHGTPGCDEQICCESVCAADPFCCDDAWDAGCAAGAIDACTACGDPDAGDCCREHAGPGCSGDACCEAVCAIDIACCTVAWDGACADAASDNAICGCVGPCPGAGSCFEPHAKVGCDDPTCCTTVCDAAPDCCEVAWDAACVAAAIELCTPCGDPGAGDCCSTHAGPGCAAADCCGEVCLVDVACCTSGWDLDCVILASEIATCACPSACGTSTACCLTAHDSPGCGTSACCGTVCDVDPLCCLVVWDVSCAAEAIALCCPADLNGDGTVDGADLGLLLEALYFPAAPGTPADFDCSGLVDSADLGFLLAEWGDC